MTAPFAVEPITIELEVRTDRVELDGQSSAASTEITVDTDTVGIGAPPSVPGVLFAVTRGAPGPPGSPGGGGSAQTIGEIPTGAIDGVNATYLTTAAFQPNTAAVYLNGLRERFITESTSTTVTFDTAPLAGDLVTIDYLLL